MYLDDFIQQLDSAITECETAQLKYSACLKYPSSDHVRQKAKVGLQNVSYQLYRLRTIRDGILIDREPDTFLQ
jgi:hypothetical protein